MPRNIRLILALPIGLALSACGDDSGAGSDATSRGARDAGSSGTTPGSDAGASDVDGGVVEDGGAGQGAGSRVMRIMPLGDSITQANADHPSYRRPLYLALEARGMRVDFVGSRNRNHAGPNPFDDFDRDHEGHWGWRADQLLEQLPEWLVGYTPDVVLMHVGTNDMFQDQTVESTLAELRAIVDELRKDNPRVTILWARLIASTRRGGDVLIRALNDGAASLAGELDSAVSPIRMVDQYTGFDPRALTYDGVHPNAAGEAQMADRWLEAIEAL